MYKLTTFEVTRSNPPERGRMTDKDSLAVDNSPFAANDHDNDTHASDDKNDKPHASMNHPNLHQSSHSTFSFSQSSTSIPLRTRNNKPIVEPLTLSYALNQVLHPSKPISPTELQPRLYRKPPCPLCQASKQAQKRRKWKRFGLSWVVSKTRF